MDGNEFKVKCKYCNRELNARYLQLLRHSLSNKHLTSAAAVTVLSLPVDVSSCLEPEGPTRQADLSEDGQMITDGEDEDAAAEPSDVKHNLADDLTAVSFVADTDTHIVYGRKKVGLLL